MPQSSPFFRLPLEIRIIIYKFVVGERNLYVHHHNELCKLPDKGTNDSPLDFPSKTEQTLCNATQKLLESRNKPSPLAIAATCQQLYHEAVKIWYGTVRFFFYSVPCTSQFLSEIGNSNRDMIQHAGFTACWGFADKVTEDILEMIMNSFPGLRSLIFEDVGNVTSMRCRNVDLYLREVGISMMMWEDEAKRLLRRREGLEKVVITTKVVRRSKYRWRFPSTQTRECREVRMDRGSGEVVIATEMVGYDSDEVDKM